jgi:hypothetical protein
VRRPKRQAPAKRAKTKTHRRPVYRVSLDDVPRPEAVAALHGVVDAVLAQGELKPEVKDAMGGVVGMMLGTFLKDPITIEVDGEPPIVVRPVDAQAFAVQSMGELTRKNVAAAMAQGKARVKK